MNFSRSLILTLIGFSFVGLNAGACGTQDPPGPRLGGLNAADTGGAPGASGGSSAGGSGGFSSTLGGAAVGGFSSGGKTGGSGGANIATGGIVGAGGSAVGGSAMGGATASGGVTTSGGSSSGGATVGGSSTTGGAETGGGVGTGGSGPILDCRPAGANLAAGLLGHWTLNDNTGTTAANAVANGQSGMINGAPLWIAGRIGQALNFPNTETERGRYVSMGNVDFGALTALGVSFWFKDGSAGDQEGGLISHMSRNGGMFNAGFEIRQSGGDIVAEVVDPVGKTSFGFGGVLPADGMWHHVVLTWTACDGQAALFLDGAALESGEHSVANLGAGARTLQLARTAEEDYQLNGALDDVRIYDRALALTEVQALAAAQ